MTYREALAWLYSLTNTESTGAFVRDREDNLARERALLAALNDPQRAYGVSHIAGSKGKGSTAATLAAILTAAGVRTGFYSSPDLHTFRERIRMDGRPISEDELARLTPQVQAALERVSASLPGYIMFEAATALAFLAFREAGAQHAVIEVGLGGRLDATNVVAPLVSVITSISYEHMNVLGHTLTEIAGEKAGIIKPGVPLVTSARAPEAVATITRIAAERGAPLLRIGPADAPDAADCAYTYTVGAAYEDHQLCDVRTPTGVYRNLELHLLGEGQIENATAAIAAAEVLRDAGLSVDEAAIRRGLRDVRWDARLQLVGRAPWRVVDGAHNADSFAKLFVALRRHFPYERLILVMGMLNDKDTAGILREIALASQPATSATSATSATPTTSVAGDDAQAAGAVDDIGGGPARLRHIVVTSAPTPRSADPTQLADQIRQVAPWLDVRVEAENGAALAAALRLAGPRDLVCVTGTLYLGAAALRWFAAQPDTPSGLVEVDGMDH